MEAATNDGKNFNNVGWTPNCIRRLESIQNF